jgi:cell wall-associated NlpC family hydrolase
VRGSPRPALVAVVLLLALGLAFVTGLSVVGGGTEGSSSNAIVTAAALAAKTCAVTGPVKGLTAEQGGNADVVVSAAMPASGGDEIAARIVLVAALVESDYDNLDAGSGRYGIFQLLPGAWGTSSQLMDPSYASEMFVQRLLAMPGWRGLAPWTAAQAVEDAVPSQEERYRRSWQEAGRVLDAVLANADEPGECGQGVGVPPGAGDALPPGYLVPPGTPPEHAAVVAFALAQLGKPYVWGGAGPNAYDCSGLTMAAWANVGVTLAHAAGVQQFEGVAVTQGELVPGDLVLVPGTDSPGPGLAGHVGIYLGDGLVESAIDTQYGVAVQSWSSFVLDGLIAMRDPAPGA